MRRVLIPLSLLFLLTQIPFLDIPPLEDDKFWWIPKALIAAERGFSLSLSGPPPNAFLQNATAALPPQWSGGIPDYGHPPLFLFYLGLIFKWFGYSNLILHLSLIPLSLASLWGTAKLIKAISRSQLTVFLFAPLLIVSPVFYAQSLRADLDLALLAVIPWALLAILQRKWLSFSLLGALAVAIKEPGVLLCVPACMAWWMWERGKGPRSLQRVFSALTPLLTLGLWACLHRVQEGWWLAKPERLPSNPVELSLDLLAAGNWLFLQQGRWALFLLILGTLTLFFRSIAPILRQRLLLLLSFVLTVWLFFSVVGFFGASAGRLGNSTHLRYFLPALPPIIALAAACAEHIQNWLSQKRQVSTGVARSAIVGILLLSAGGALWDLFSAPLGGPERNLFAVQQVIARQEAAPIIHDYLENNRRVWIGEAEALDYQFPGAGIVKTPVGDALRFGPSTQTSELSIGDIVCLSAHGEPSGTLRLRLLEAQSIRTVKVGQAWVRFLEIAAIEEN